MVIEQRSVAIIASREEPATVENCIKSVIYACTGRTVVIDVLINGNSRLAQDVAHILFDCPPRCQLRIWNIKQRDKAHAWNEYVHRIWPRYGNAFFLDGYVEVEPTALDALEQTLLYSTDALAATGVPTSGRSADRDRAYMLREGGFQGNLHVLRLSVMQQLRARGFRLPLGLYRTDSVTGALLLLGLDSTIHCWDKRRIAVASSATWKVQLRDHLTYRRLVAQWKRIFRQAQGELENSAVREHLIIRKLPPELLAPTVHALVNSWIANRPKEARQLFCKHPLSAYAAWRLRTPRDWSAATVAPIMLTTMGEPTQLFNVDGTGHGPGD